MHIDQANFIQRHSFKKDYQINEYSNFDKKMKEKAKEYAIKAQHLALQGRFREASQVMGSALVYTKSKLDQARYTAKIEEFKMLDIRLKTLQK